MLVEHAEPAARAIVALGLRDEGYEVLTCGGPDPAGMGDATSCPLLAGDTCPAVTGADAVVTSLHLAGEEGRIVERIVVDPASPPVIAEATDWQVDSLLGTPTAVRHIYPFASVDQIATAIRTLGTDTDAA